MRSRGISRLIWAAFFAVGLTLPNKPTDAANCVLYVRAETGVALYGAAGGWWSEAEGWYARGQVPGVGAILVFKRTGHMPSGHVAIVTKLIGPREILVDHANWYHGTVSRGASVLDTSPGGDWTRVAVMEAHSGKHGRDNPTFGFNLPG
jgi:surface antigen